MDIDSLKKYTDGCMTGYIDSLQNDDSLRYFLNVNGKIYEYTRAEAFLFLHQMELIAISEVLIISGKDELYIYIKACPSY